MDRGAWRAPVHSIAKNRTRLSDWATRTSCIGQETLNSGMCPPGWEEGFGGEWMHVYVWLSPFTVHLKLPQLC